MQGVDQQIDAVSAALGAQCATQIASVTSIQIKLHNDADGRKVRDLLQAAFPPEIYSVQTWRDKLLGIGSIEIIPLDDDAPEGVWQTIARPRQVHEQLISSINKARQGGCGM